MLCCTIQGFISLVLGNLLLQSVGQLLSQHLTQLIPNYKVTKENDTLQLASPLSCHPVSSMAGSWATVDHMAVRGYRICFPPPLSVSLRRKISNSQRRPKGFSSTTVNWNCIFSFSFLREIMSKQCLNSHFRNNY